MIVYAKSCVAIIFLIISGFGSVDAQDEHAVVELSATALIQNDDFDSARLAAIAEAEKGCIKKALNSGLLSPTEYKQNARSLETLFLEDPDPYIAQFSIENEEIIDDGQKYQVNVSAYVLTNAMRIALLENGIGNVFSICQTPTVMVLVRERFETRVSGTQTAETVLINILQEKDFKVIDPEQKKLIDMRNRLFSESTGNILMAQQTAIGFKADYLIFGKAAITSSGPLSGTDLKARFANLKLNIVEASSGLIVATENGRGKAKHIDELTGGNWALEEAADKVGAKVISKFETHMKQELMAGTEIVVDISGLEYASQATEAEAALKQTKNVGSVYRRFYVSGMGQFEIKFKGTSADFANTLKNIEIDGQPLSLIETMPRYLRIQRGSAPQTATDDTRDLLKQYLEEKYRHFNIEKAREQDKELLEKINALSHSTKISDAQKKQLYAAQKQIEVAREEAYYRQKELEKRIAELKVVQDHQQQLGNRYGNLSRKLEQLKNERLKTNQKESDERSKTESQSPEHKRKQESDESGIKERQYKELYQLAKNDAEKLRRELEKAKKDNYTASHNHSNAQNNMMSTAEKYLESIDEGVELFNRINKLFSLF